MESIILTQILISYIGYNANFIIDTWLYLLNRRCCVPIKYFKFYTSHFFKIQDKAEKKKPLKSLDEKPQAATPTHPTTSTILDAGPQLDITQLATEPVPDKPKPEIIYVSR